MLVIAHVSDTHFGNDVQDPAARAAAVMDHLLAMDPRPDVLLVSGDVADHGLPESLIPELVDVIRRHEPALTLGSVASAVIAQLRADQPVRIQPRHPSPPQAAIARARPRTDEHGARTGGARRGQCRDACIAVEHHDRRAQPLDRRDDFRRHARRRCGEMGRIERRRRRALGQQEVRLGLRPLLPQCLRQQPATLHLAAACAAGHRNEQDAGSGHGVTRSVEVRRV